MEAIYIYIYIQFVSFSFGFGRTRGGFTMYVVCVLKYRYHFDKSVPNPEKERGIFFAS